MMCPYNGSGCALEDSCRKDYKEAETCGYYKYFKYLTEFKRPGYE
jgi:hypothetical protein